MSPCIYRWPELVPVSVDEALSLSFPDDQLVALEFFPCWFFDDATVPDPRDPDNWAAVVDYDGRERERILANPGRYAGWPANPDLRVYGGAS